jgi:hypothetical protein
MWQRLSGVLALLACAWTLEGACEEVHPAGNSYANRSGTILDTAALRFTEAGWNKGRDRGFAVALQRNTNYFYLWTTNADGVAAGGRPLCDGYLIDQKGRPVDVDAIKSFATADFDGNGSTYLVALVNGGQSIVAWHLDHCEGKAILSSIADPQPLVTENPSRAYQRLLADDFENTGADEVEAIAEKPAQASDWKLSGTRFELVRSTPLFVSRTSAQAVNEIRYVTTTRLPHAEDNVAYEAATIVLHDRGFTLFRRGVALYYAPTCAIAPENCANKILLFNLDQGFADGLQDQMRKHSAEGAEILRRMIKALRAVPSSFKVWALVNPIQEDRAATLRVLDALSEAGIPFVLDYYSSDVTALAAVKRNLVDYSPRAFDALKGVSLSVEGNAAEPDNLAFFARRYGARFVGVRFMERLGMDIQVNDMTFAPMLPDRALAQQELSFDWTLAKRLLKWAKSSGRYVVWADPALYVPYECYWSTDEVMRAMDRRDSYVSKERELARGNPYVIPMYDNNEGLKRCGVAKGSGRVTPRNFRLTGWERIPRATAGVKTGREALTGRDGFGISVQSWTTDYDAVLSAGTLPPEEIAVWILEAIEKGAGMVEVEPYFYLFDWPTGTAVPQSKSIPSGEEIGDARDTFKEIFREVAGH